MNDDRRARFLSCKTHRAIWPDHILAFQGRLARSTTWVGARRRAESSEGSCQGVVVGTGANGQCGGRGYRCLAAAASRGADGGAQRTARPTRIGEPQHAVRVRSPHKRRRTGDNGKHPGGRAGSPLPADAHGFTTARYKDCTPYHRGLTRRTGGFVRPAAATPIADYR